MILQMAVMPGQERRWTMGDDLVYGYALSAADAAWARTPRELFEAHALGFPGSPFSPESPVLDVLRFETTPLTTAVAATGRVTAADGSVTGEGFVDHPPFTGTGFVATTSEHLLPLWWLEPMRLAPSSELWRVHADGREELLFAYLNVASGWQPAPEPTLGPSEVCGVFATWQGSEVLADVLGNGRAVIASARELPGLHLTERGFWGGAVDAARLSDVHSLRLTATWRGLRFQIVKRWMQGEEMIAQLVYIGRDMLAAEAAGLVKMNAGAYEATAPVAELADLQGAQFSLPAAS